MDWAALGAELHKAEVWQEGDFGSEPGWYFPKEGAARRAMEE